MMTESWRKFVGKTRGEKPRVLVVDDDLSMVEGISEYLSYNGYETVPLQAGSDELRDLSVLPPIIESIKPDAVITDGQMGEFNGIDLLRKVREHHPDLPVFLYSATSKLVSSALNDGFTGALDKSSSLKKLPEMLITNGIKPSGSPPRSGP